MPRFPSCQDAQTDTPDLEAISNWISDSVRPDLGWPVGRSVVRHCGYSRCVNPQHIFPCYKPDKETVEFKQNFFLHKYNTGAMATTQSLKKSPSEMSREEIEEELLALRKSRRGNMKAKKSPTSHKVKKKKEKTSSDLSALLADMDNMSPEQLAELKAKLANK